MTSILAFAFVLGALILVHELGHFMVAKLFGVRVLTFSFGFGPRLIGRRWGETEYILSLLPLGGYVRMLGEEPTEEVPKEEERCSFALRPLRQRAAIVAAGPLSNLLFASFLFAFVFWLGVPKLLPVIGEVMEDFPAAQAGLKPGDRVLEIEGRQVRYWETLLEVIPRCQGRELHLLIERGGRRFELKIRPKAVKRKNIFGEEVEVYQIGVVPSGQVGIERHRPLEAFLKGLRQTYWVSKLVVLSVVKIIRGVISAKTIGGPIMIAQMAGQEAEKGLLRLLFFTALLSVNLGLLNLFPIPILDGGHLLLMGLEGVLRRPLDTRKLEVVQKVGLIIIVSLMVLAFYNDITRIWRPK